MPQGDTEDGLQSKLKETCVPRQHPDLQQILHAWNPLKSSNPPCAFPCVLQACLWYWEQACLAGLGPTCCGCAGLSRLHAAPYVLNRGQRSSLHNLVPAAGNFRGEGICRVKHYEEKLATFSVFNDALQKENTKLREALEESQAPHTATDAEVQELKAEFARRMATVERDNARLRASSSTDS